jgi:hypothetical protein
MQPFIIEALRKITEELTAAPKQTRDSATAENDLVLDTSMAEALSNGSFIFPSTDGDAEPDWCVLAFYAADASRRSLIFRFRGRLRAGATPDDFVSRAYELILMRAIDDTGRGIYPDLIDKYLLSKRDVLKILASSPEAEDLNVKYIVVPEPSSWLSQLGVIPGDDGSFPALTVRVPE